MLESLGFHGRSAAFQGGERMRCPFGGLQHRSGCRVKPLACGEAGSMSEMAWSGSAYLFGGFLKWCTPKSSI